VQLDLSLSPISLLEQEFLHVELTAIPSDEFGPGNIDVDREVYQDEDNPKKWTVVLTVMIKGVEDKPSPAYIGGVTARGLYRVHENYTGDQKKLIRITGASMLYGAIREMVSYISARSPNGMISLPSVSFIEPTEKPKKVTAEKAAKKKVVAKGKAKAK